MRLRGPTREKDHKQVEDIEKEDTIMTETKAISTNLVDLSLPEPISKLQSLEETFEQSAKMSSRIQTLFEKIILVGKHHSLCRKFNRAFRWGKNFEAQTWESPGFA